MSSYYSVSAHRHPIKAAYYPSWDTDFDLSSIEANLFTHIYYAFLTPNNFTFKFDIDPEKAEQLEHFTSTLHAIYPPVKALFSVGGASEETDLFSHMVSSSRSRTDFVRSAVQVARDFGFDGVDLDWDAPRNPMDMTKLGHLLEELRAEVQKEARGSGRAPLLVTAAVYYSADTFAYGPPRAYPAASISKNLDWVHVMSYDYRGSWDKTATGAHAALFDPTSDISTSSGLRSWIGAGVPPHKLVMGLPLYGRTWTLRDPARSQGVGAPAVDVGPSGRKGRGVLSYAQVVSFNEDTGAQTVYDEETVSAYSVAGDSWIGYDDERSVAEKIRYAKTLGIGGYFFWEITGDYHWTISEAASESWSL